MNIKVSVTTARVSLHTEKKASASLCTVFTNSNNGGRCVITTSQQLDKQYIGLSSGYECEFGFLIGRGGASDLSKESGLVAFCFMEARFTACETL